ncbi:MAG TPA: sporulation protein YunB [Candidatus Merdivicinus excrementipullorum]|uniref:Sporulation protein YunB n=1 Tax=Candidatus Merdivicinus excrementipullorum TaxID=2840867 RepID=A0A9D1FPJ2_9FIRM|nr:sporulation protein YunB [Candidatus Merdivicinus excrementipullorum]
MRKKTAALKRFHRYIFLAAALLAGIALIWESRVRPAARELAETYAVQAAQQAMSRGVSEYLASETGSLLQVETGAENVVRFVETDMAQVNRIKLGVTETILQNFQEMPRQEVKIPLGLLMGSQMFSGLGPDLTCRFYPHGSFQIRLESRFEEAGVNQTRYQLMLCTEAKVTSLLAGTSADVSVPTEYLLAETILAGEVPENYTRVLTTGEEFISELNDYQAE